MKHTLSLLLGAALLGAMPGTMHFAQAAPPGRAIIKSPIRITSPENNAVVESQVTVRGSAPARQQVDVQVTAVYDGGQRNLGVMKTTAQADGKWMTRPIKLLLPDNAKNAHFEIVASYQDGKRKIISSTVKVRLAPKVVTVRPGNVVEKVKPRINPGNFPQKPRDYVKPTITGPRGGNFLSMPIDYPVRGKATPNRDVKVTVTGKWEENGRTKSRQIDQKTVRADSNGKWTATMHFESVGVNHPSSHEITARDKVFPDEAKVTVQESIKPTIVTPRENEEWAPRGNYFISGRGAPNSRFMVSITAHWTSISGNTRRSNQRVIASSRTEADARGNWGVRLQFNPVDTGPYLNDAFYIISVQDLDSKNTAATSVTERK